MLLILDLATLLKSLTRQYGLYIDFCFLLCIRSLNNENFVSSLLIPYCTMLNSSKENGYLGLVPKLKENVLKVEDW